VLNSWEQEKNELVQQNDEDLLQRLLRFIFMGFLSKSKAKAMYSWVIIYSKV
jgi:hypothetical protein